MSCTPGPSFTTELQRSSMAELNLSRVNAFISLLLSCFGPFWSKSRNGCVLRSSLQCDETESVMRINPLCLRQTVITCSSSCLSEVCSVMIWVWHTLVFLSTLKKTQMALQDASLMPTHTIVLAQCGSYHRSLVGNGVLLIHSLKWFVEWHHRVTSIH